MTQLVCMSLRMRVVLGILLLTSVYVGYTLYNLQVTRHDELLAKAKEKYTAKKVTSGSRGEIYDYDGNLLVSNIPTCDIYVDPSETGDGEQCDKIARFFVDVLGRDYKVDYQTLYHRLMNKTFETRNEDGEPCTRKRRYAVIEKYVEFDLAQRLKIKVAQLGFKGVYFKDSVRRNYLKDSMLANIIGFTNIDRDRVQAVDGLEKFFDKSFQSEMSTYTYERARDGLPISYGNFTMEEVRDGSNLYLTIQEPLQAIVEEELDQLMETSQARAGYAVMADPETGNILAIAQRPTYNPNDRSTMNPDAYRNRIAEDIMEPGSIMKPIAVSGAIDRGIVQPGTRFDTNNGLWYYAGKPLRDSHRMGVLTVHEIIQKSSNIGTAKIALAMGNQNLYDTLRAFGFGQRTGIALRTETRGILHPVRKWSMLSPTRMCIGQGVAVSPLQMIKAYCMLANGGHPVSLRLVDRMENPDDHTVKKFPVKRGESIYRNPATHQIMISMMRSVTEEGGTAKMAAVPGFHVAGKTGTSQKVINGQYSHSQYFASFVGFVPAEHPRFVLLVTADEPKGKNVYGGGVSGPYFRSISERALKYMNVQPDIPLDQWEADRKNARKQALAQQHAKTQNETRRRAEQRTGTSSAPPVRNRRR